MLEKDGERTRIYIGSGTNSDTGLRYRWTQYDNKVVLPSGLVKAFADGFEITHKGLLCWIPMPKPAKVLMFRLLFLALECFFTYVFWTMRPDTHDDGMRYICPWMASSIEYDSVDSHGSLVDHPQGDFDLTEEQLEAQAEVAEAKFRLNKANCATNYHFKQMAENYDEYIGNAIDRKMKSRALHPELDAIAQKTREDKNKADKKYHCSDCNLSYGRQNVLDDHYDTEKHKRMLKANRVGNANKCHLCNMPFARPNSLSRHRKESQLHARNVTAAKAKLALTAQSSS